MVIKSKGWTAIPAVKIVSFVLIILLAFAFVSTAFLMQSQIYNGRTNLEIVFGNLSGNSLFYSSYINRTLSDLQELLFFESEENIKQGNCLRWVERDSGLWLESSDGSRTWSNVYATEYGLGDYAFQSGSGQIAISWSESGGTSYEQENDNERQLLLERESLEKIAINNQLQSFRRLKNIIQSYNGLVYYIAKPSFEHSNVDRRDIDFYVQNPVYLIVEKGLNVAQSHNFDFPASGDSTIYIGYTAEAINTQNAHWQSMQRVVIQSIAAIIGIVVLACALFIALLCGAGRKRGAGSVYFNILDKPYLDIGFGLLFLYVVMICNIFMSAHSYGYYGYYNTYVSSGYLGSEYFRNILVLVAIAIGLILPPVLYYTMSFAKRVKAGKWWRYTLVWQMWNAVWNRCVRFARSLWAGVPLTLRTLLAVFCMFCVMIIIAAASGSDGAAIPMSFFAAVVIAVPMLNYASRLNKLEAGAKAVSEGRYGDIFVRGGTLGKIAEHVNNISAGIESAVDERLKSERLKTELITNVSHDIRTPLTSLITYTDLLKNEGLLSEHAPEYLEILIQKSQRLKTLTDELFEAAKASSGNIETHIESLDFSALMRQVLGELDERIQASSLDFRTNLPEHIWVMADGKLLWRVAENLLSNVFKYSLPQSRVYIDLTRENGEVRLDIKNISADSLNVDPSELTERFKRGDDSRSSEGSGLGLSIVQSFVEAQNGRFKLAIDGDLFKASVFMPASKQ